MASSEKTKSKKKSKSNVSDRKIKANGENAQKSTGPRSEEGKSQSRLNGMTHGMCVKVVALIEGEDREEYEARRLAWIGSLAPTDEVAMGMAQYSFDEFWRLRRCLGVETSTLSMQVRHASKKFEREQIANLSKLTSELPSDPLRVASELRSSVAGCDWIVSKLRWLKVAMDDRGYWYESEKDLALNLFGRRPADVFGADTFASELFDAYILSAWARGPVNANWKALGVVRPESITEAEFHCRMLKLVPDVYQEDPTLKSLDCIHERLYARRELSSMITAEIDLIQSQREQMLADESHDRADARKIAGFDLTSAGASRLRYEMTHRRAVQATLADLAKRKTEAEADPDPPVPLEVPKVAYLLDVTILPDPDNFIDPRPRPMGPEIRIDRPPPNEPITIVLPERKPIARKRFRNEDMNTPAIRKAPSAEAWAAANIFPNDGLKKINLVPCPIEIRTTVQCELLIE